MLALAAAGFLFALTVNADPAGTFFEVNALPPAADTLDTPQACVEHFVAAARRGAWDEAAAALDTRLLAADDAARAAELARRFFFVLNQELWIDWDSLPDRRDGALARATPTAQDTRAPEPRRSIRLGAIEIDERTVPVRVSRLKAADGTTAWLFSAQTVENVDALWATHGPTWLAQQMPDWAQQRGPLRVPYWQWIGLVLACLLAPLVGFVFGARIASRVAKSAPGSARELAARVQWPTAALVTTTLLLIVVESVLGLPSAVATLAEPAALIAFVASIVWLAMRVTTYFIDTFVKDTIRDYSEEEPIERRRLLTQITVVRHVVLLLLALVGIAVILLELNAFRTVGVALLSSAGAAAVILGIAGHAVLGNLIAGLQIALVQPFRIGDTVFVADNWGKIEDITYVDVIVRTWDERRLVFPISYFNDHWFENWSKTDPYLLKPIYLKVDYRADVARIREKFVELVEADEDWAKDRNEPEVLVTDCDEETMTVRLTCAGPDPGAAWSLVCRVREGLLAWLAEVEDGAWLPQRRVLLGEGDD